MYEHGVFLAAQARNNEYLFIDEIQGCSKRDCISEKLAVWKAVGLEYEVDPTDEVTLACTGHHRQETGPEDATVSNTCMRVQMFGLMSSCLNNGYTQLQTRNSLLIMVRIGVYRTRIHLLCSGREAGKQVRARCSKKPRYIPESRSSNSEPCTQPTICVDMNVCINHSVGFGSGYIVLDLWFRKEMFANRPVSFDRCDRAEIRSLISVK